MRELKEALHFNFHSYDVIYSPRKCNKVAHALAALGCRSSMEDSPVPVVEISLKSSRHKLWPPPRFTDQRF